MFTQQGSARLQCHEIFYGGDKATSQRKPSSLERCSKEKRIRFHFLCNFCFESISMVSDERSWSGKKIKTSLHEADHAFQSSRNSRRHPLTGKTTGPQTLRGSLSKEEKTKNFARKQLLSAQFSIGDNNCFCDDKL